MLASIDPECKKHVTAVLAEVQTVLLRTTGYLLVPGDAIRGYRQGKHDEFYLVNTLLENKSNGTNTSRNEAEIARSILLRNRSQSATIFHAFKFVVFHLILNGTGKQVALSEILRELRKLEGRFQATISQSELKSSSSKDVLQAVPELEDHLLGLLARMQREQYVVVAKDEADHSDVMKTLYSFGPRFHLEIGQAALLMSYFQLLGQPVDETDLRLLLSQVAYVSLFPIWARTRITFSFILG